MSEIEGQGSSGSSTAAAPTASQRADQRLITAVRIRAFVGLASVGLLGLAMVLGLAGAFSHRSEFTKPAILALAAAVGANAVVEGFRAWMLWRIGAWMGMDGMRRTRAERPGMFKAWLVTHLFAAGVLASVALLLGSVPFAG